MEIVLNLTSQKTVKIRVDAPCSGLVAKAVGKMKLEEMHEVMVVFDTYQEGVDKPKQQLADDAEVVRGSILHFNVGMDQVLRTQAQHQKLLAYLMAPKLVDVVGRFSARLVSGQVITEGDVSDNPKSGVQNKVVAEPDLKHRLEAALDVVSSDYSVEEFAKALDDTYNERCSKRIHSCAENNTKKVLKEEMEELCDSGAVELLVGKYPVACTIVSNYDIFLRLLD